MIRASPFVECMNPNETAQANLMRLPWQVLALAAVFVFFPFYLRDIYPPDGAVRDFFQDWSSARSFLEGGPVYPSLPDAAQRYLSISLNPESMHLGQYSTHPPASVIVYLPLGYLPYRTAFLVWNLLSLLLFGMSLFWMLQGLGIRLTSPLMWLGLAVCATASPLQSQVYHAQMNLLLLFLITASWRADRTSSQGLAGMYLGLAAALKFMPAYLFLVFLARGRWRAIVVGGLTFLGCQALALGLFGWDAFVFYQQHLMPHLGEYRSAWLNQSLNGFFSRLFDVGSQTPNVEPLLAAPWLAKSLYWACAGAMTGMMGWLIWRRGFLRGEDQAWALTLTGMLLVSPFTWDHYLVLLAWPMLLVVPRLARRNSWLSWLFGLTLGLLWLHPAAAWDWTIPGGFDQGRATPLRSLTWISYKFYALLLLFYIQTKPLLSEVPARKSSDDQGKS